VPQPGCLDGQLVGHLAAARALGLLVDPAELAVLVEDRQGDVVSEVEGQHQAMLLAILWDVGNSQAHGILWIVDVVERQDGRHVIVFVYERSFQGLFDNPPCVSAGRSNEVSAGHYTQERKSEPERQRGVARAHGLVQWLERWTQ
jgi:hypothetical protein